MPTKAGIQRTKSFALGPRFRGDERLNYAASARAPFSGAVIAPDVLISAMSLSP